jgi:hypothetical protein
MKYQRGAAGEPQYLVRDRRWRVRPVEGTHAYVQPVTTTTVDAVRARLALPAARHIRMSARTDAATVLRGAPALIAQGGASTICCSAAPADATALRELLVPYGWAEAHQTAHSGSLRLLFLRESPRGGGRA